MDTKLTPAVQLLRIESINGRWKWEDFNSDQEREDWLDMEAHFEYADIAKMINWACKQKRFPRNILVQRIISAVVNNKSPKEIAGKSEVQNDGSFYA